MTQITKIPGRIESSATGNVVTGANSILDDAKGKKQNVINNEVDAELVRLDHEKQNNLTFDNAPTEDSDNPVKSGGVYAADKALNDAIEAILLLIPSAASSLNQLADKNFVNSSISTATAIPRGTYNLVSDLDLTTDATRDTIAEKLGEVIDVADLNDYAFVQVPVSDEDPTEIERTERYKFNGNVWIYEYTLNTSGFTAAQWAAINSGITTALVEKLDGLPTAAALELALGTITQNIQNIGALIPSEATANNQLADKAYVLAQTLAATPSFKGQFTTFAQLQNVADPKDGDLGIVRTKDSAGHDVFTFYQNLNNQWNEYYVMSYHPQDKPATTGWLGEYPYNGMGRIELPKNMVDGWPDNTWIYLPKNDVVYLMYYWNGLLYAPYNSGMQEGLGLDDNLVVKPLDYNIADIEQFVGERYLPFTESSGVWTITKPDDSTITSTELNNTNIYKINDPTHIGINVLTQEMLNRTNTIYVIQYDFILGEDITVPENCILEFDGGSISNGTIIGNNTNIEAGLIKIFGEDINLNGTWDVENAYPEWFGIEENVDSTEIINKTLRVFRRVKLCRKNYTVDNTIYLDGEKTLLLSGITKIVKIANNDNPVISITGGSNSLLGECKNSTIQSTHLSPYGVVSLGDYKEELCKTTIFYNKINNLTIKGDDTYNPRITHDQYIQSIGLRFKHTYKENGLLYAGYYNSITNILFEYFNIGLHFKGDVNGNFVRDIVCTYCGTGDFETDAGITLESDYFSPDGGICACQENNITHVFVTGSWRENDPNNPIDPEHPGYRVACLCLKGSIYYNTIVISGENGHEGLGVTVAGDSSAQDNVKYNVIITNFVQYWGNSNTHYLYKNNILFDSSTGINSPMVKASKFITSNIESEDIHFNKNLLWKQCYYNFSTYLGIATEDTTYAIFSYRFINATNRKDFIKYKLHIGSELSYLNGVIEATILLENGTILAYDVSILNSMGILKPVVNNGQLDILVRTYNISGNHIHKGKASIEIEIVSDRIANDDGNSIIILPQKDDNNDIVAYSGSTEAAYVSNIGTTEQRPTYPIKGLRYFDETLNNEVIWNGQNWNNPRGSFGMRLSKHTTFSVPDNKSFVLGKVNLSRNYASCIVNIKLVSFSVAYSNRVAYYDIAFNKTEDLGFYFNAKGYTDRNGFTLLEPIIDGSDISLEFKGPEMGNPNFICYIHAEVTCYIAKDLATDECLILNDSFVESENTTIVSLLNGGSDSAVPNFPNIGQSYYNTDINKVSWWDGENWVNNVGALITTPTEGTFADKPTSAVHKITRGFAYFCTDKQTTEGATNGIMIYYKQLDTTDPNNPVDIWVDALGRVVS